MGKKEHCVAGQVIFLTIQMDRDILNSMVSW
jgi:hypothetical protein